MVDPVRSLEKGTGEHSLKDNVSQGDKSSPKGGMKDILDPRKDYVTSGHSTSQPHSSVHFNPRFVGSKSSSINSEARPQRHTRLSSLNEFHDPFSTAEVYYGPETNPNKHVATRRVNRPRTMSVVDTASDFKNKADYDRHLLKRRGSEDDTYLSSKGNRRFFIENVDEMLRKLLATEDTDKNFQITIEDTGPKVIKVGTANSDGFKYVNIRGTYMLSNLLQELTIAQSFGRSQIFLDEARINENPVDRLTRLIHTQFWDNLTRRVDLNSIAQIALDTKIDTPGAKNPRVYVPYNCPKQYEFYIQASQMDPSLSLEVEYLPRDITPEYVKSLNETPGLLALAMEEHVNPSSGELTLVGYPYAVPGGRFNEFYGWDSYMIALGLLEGGKTHVARGMVEHFIFEIEHYGKTLNANRTYYLCRSQPPFLTDMALQVFKKLGGKSNPDAIDFLQRACQAAIKEYKTVWAHSPRLDAETGLSCYHPVGLGIPPETEEDHFDSLLDPYYKKYNASREEFVRMYNEGEIREPKLDEFFMHDRAVRESGHDTTYRFEGVCAHLATIDLNSLLYKYEKDIADIIEQFFGDEYHDTWDDLITDSQYWRNLAQKRKSVVTKCMWDEETGFFFDYNTKTKQKRSYESATTLWALWAGLATEDQAKVIVEKALPRLEVLGGIVACTERSRGPLSVKRPPRQWDFPYGWAPHQILAWHGLSKYGFLSTATRLAYRWLYIMTKAFVDYNGIVVEKYDVTKGTDPHRVNAEYGNQGADFKGVAKEGFGWVNASYVLGLSYMNNHAKRALATCVPPVPFFNSLRPKERNGYGLQVLS
ncbi:alpha,alpha-trehalase nth1 [Zygosaccharomyces mellis]|uniref:Trehalase n=1 Tax=Zygosaccharomyces mellis TaxID=42258 RepID=A0A4C2E688_9SACH|nr:alpha,alpha-trehalase nth1 [Zygosaccharomyces mellis]